MTAATSRSTGNNAQLIQPRRVFVLLVLYRWISLVPPMLALEVARKGDINDCLAANGEEPIKNLKTGDIALLVSAFREQFNGQPMAVDVSHPGAVKWYERGRKYYWTKRGQLNFSCADCHVRSAGNKLRGDVLSAGLGHTTGFPVYRTKWAVAGKPWGTVHRRYGGCNEQVRATASAPQSDEYKALEFYEAVMNTGVPVKSPSQRQ